MSCTGMTGALSVAGRLPVVALAEADHALAAMPLFARTCTWWAVAALTPLIVAEVDVPIAGRPVDSWSTIQSPSSDGSVPPWNTRRS